MTTKPEERKRQRIEEVVARLAERRGDPARVPEAAAAAGFVRSYYASVAPDDVLAASRDHLLAAALSLWELGAERPAETPKVRVWNPTVAADGWRCDHTVAEVVNDDMPFLVTSVTGALNRRGRSLHLVAHPVVSVDRDKAGRRRPAKGPSSPESYIHVEFDQETSPAALAEIAAELAEVLADVRAAVSDWPVMREKVGEIADGLERRPPPVAGEKGAEELAEAVAFLRWLADDHFVFAGYREYDLVEEDGAVYLRFDPDSGLGVLRTVKPDTRERARRPLAPQVAAHARLPAPLFVTKAYDRATVHRQVHLDYVGVRRFDEAGRVVGERRFVGLFTSAVYDDSVRHIPLVRRKVAATVARCGFIPGSHDARALIHILETLPRDELFQISADDLHDLARGLLQLQERQHLALFVRRDPLERFVSCLVYVPRDRYSTALRERMKEILAEAFAGTVRAFDVSIGDSPLARVLFVIRTTPGAVPERDVKEVEARLVEAARTWGDRFKEELVARLGEEEGLALFARYEGAFPAAFRDDFDAAAAVDDLFRIEALLAAGGTEEAGVPLETRLYRPAGAAPHEVNFKVYRKGTPRPLSDVLPMLENMGFKVLSEVPYAVEPAGAPGAGDVVWLRDFELEALDVAEVDVEAVEERFAATFARVWSGEVDDDGFNRLVVAAGLSWREVVALRTYYRYQRQIGLAFSQAYTAAALARNPEPTRLLLALFRARFDPGVPDDARERRQRAAHDEFRESLNTVAALDEDRILRRFRSLIRTTLRTNYFQQAAGGGGPKPYLSIKLDSRAIRRLPQPKPLYEIFVHSPRTEAVHLRGGKVARGGVRWSDRPEDFRGEVLGLMKAQMVKNAVIIPVGAKGGFVVRRPPPGGREEVQREAVECYRTMVRGLLDLTDNLRGDEVVPPPDVVRHDDDDPYLVVAADKGTATFSDYANALAAEYGFWLGDAFASGGSAGYDHKAMGITAKGAWESVKRHFRELGTDVQSEPTTVVGVGDMSGDVFGNGMLLSAHLRLVGAFNHLHVFVDPDPDPAVSFAERRRLFDARGGWGDYDRARISAGGGVFDRKTKSIPVSPEMRERFGLDRGGVAPDELIRALLTAEVDLLWFGGIGTFVKAADESHADAGDRANDELRVDAADLRCRVIGEGANLGLSQRGRIEFALAGGKVNTDAIDNSGGVDTSDHEVNIKIALGDAVGRGRITLEERNRLLAAMTDDVARLVLRDNYLQGQAISIAEAEGHAQLDAQTATMRELERAGRLDRALEFLPDDETLTERRDAGRGLTRPEIAVLLAYAKISLYADLVASDLPDEADLVHELELYFPPRLAAEFRDEIGRHRLRREIIATHVTNSMVNRVGPTFVARMREATGAAPTDVARAYTIGREAFDLRRVWSEVEALDNRVPARVQLGMLREAGRLVERATLWLLRNARHRLDLAARVAEFRPGAAAVLAELESILPASDLAARDRRREALAAEGVPAELARWMASAPVLASACDIVGIARDGAGGAGGGAVEKVARAYFALGARFGLDELRARAAGIQEGGDQDRWQASAAEALIQDLFAHQSAMTASALADGGRETTGAAAACETWIGSRRRLVERLDATLAEVRAAPAADLAMLAVVNHQLRLLIAGA